MSSFELNKIIASVLTAMIIAMFSGILASEIVRPKPLEKPAYVVPGVEAAASGGAAGAAGGQAAGPEPIEPLMAKADPAHGQQLAKACTQCHTFDKGGKNLIGPNLFGITEDPMAHLDNYQYSSALAAHKGEKWDLDKLNQWLYKPQMFVKGTKMTYAGLPKGQDRADVIAFLQSLK